MHSDVVRELGYPRSQLLPRWYKAYLKEQETGIVNNGYMRASMYTSEQEQAAVVHYLEHGRNISRTVRVLRYPCKETLRQWCNEFAPFEARYKN